MIHSRLYTDASGLTAISEKYAFHAELVQIKKSYDFMQNEHREMTGQYTGVCNQYEALKIAHDKMQQAHDARDNQHQSQAAELTALQRNVMELQLNLKARNEKIALIEGSLASANDKVETLRHENQFALQEKASLVGQLKQLQAMMSSVGR